MRFAVKNLAEAPRDLLTGFAQIMLQPSPLIGAVFIGGAVWNSFIIAAFGVFGCLSGVLTAIILNYPRDERYEGLYGFNGALTGLCMSYFYETTPLLGGLVVLGGIVSTMIMYRMLRRNIRPFTFPFVAVTWFMMIGVWVADEMSRAAGKPSGQENIIALEALSRSVGQVLFQEDIITGIIFATAIAIRDRIQGLYVILAAGLGLGCAYMAEYPIDLINLGLFGYSGVLCGIAFAGCRTRDFVSAVAAILLSIITMHAFHKLDMIALTFPFIFASWVVLWIRSKALRRVTSTSN